MLLSYLYLLLLFHLSLNVCYSRRSRAINNEIRRRRRRMPNLILAYYLDTSICCSSDVSLITVRHKTSHEGRRFVLMRVKTMHHLGLLTWIVRNLGTADKVWLMLRLMSMSWMIIRSVSLRGGCTTAAWFWTLTVVSWLRYSSRRFVVIFDQGLVVLCVWMHCSLIIRYLLLVFRRYLGVDRMFIVQDLNRSSPSIIAVWSSNPVWNFLNCNLLLLHMLLWVLKCSLCRILLLHLAIGSTKRVWALLLQCKESSGVWGWWCAILLDNFDLVCWNDHFLSWI